MDVGDPVIMDSAGAKVIRTEPAGQVGLLVDLEGKLLELEVRVAYRFLMSSAQAAALVAELVVAGQHAAVEDGPDGDARTFLEDLENGIVREQRRRGMIG